MKQVFFGNATKYVRRRRHGDAPEAILANDHTIMVSDHIFSFIRDNNTNEFFYFIHNNFGAEKLLRYQIIYV